MSDIKTIAQIIQGHTNKALANVGLLDEDVKKMADLRFADCLLCEHTPHPTNPGQNGPGLREQKYCKNCSCDMMAKTKVPSAKCPIGRW